MFRGWLALGDREIANSSRVVALADPAGLPATDTEGFAAEACAPCRNLAVGRDDSWPGLRAYLADPPYTDITTAPWYDGTDTSREFLGVWVMSADGFDGIPVSRDISDAVCSGGVASVHRDSYRTLSFSALVWGCTHRGARHGLRWLNCQLRAARAPQILRYLDAHPEQFTADGLERSMRQVVLTQPAVVREVAGLPIGNHQQASMFRVEFELVALDPYPWTAATTHPVTWDTQDVHTIEWAHAPDCVDATCELPVLLSTQCPPQTIDTRPAPIPVCGGCLPVCEIDTRTWQLDLTDVADCDLVAASIQVTAGTVSDTTVRFWWRPCGSTDICDETGQLQITGLPAGQTVVADSVEGRSYGLVSGQRVRQRGIVATPSGAPWHGTLLRPGCWELIAQSEPGITYTVSVDTIGRPA
ncbi:sugar transferase [Nocardia sp. CDC159]|uniref:Sugar transferase n=1 Tax=Nocardia pulmonis TaxID=2951408 RepID=A0A9X2E716_9NOCA|nr:MULTISPECIES: sugar transferase [Nocardia]MCM6774964.1 sugar transferase [Nocardia pulmonis]MCM6789895.1 sugar transferase [Nocardia sp. CDC159]